MAVGIAVLLFAQPLMARPIVFARSTTVMAEYREGTMTEAQLFYAPRHHWSLGAGYVELEGSDLGARHSVTYGRLNFLAKRWNGEAMQANVFFWGGAGVAYIGDRVIQPVRPDTPPPPPSEHNHGGPPPDTAVPIRVPAFQEFAWNAGGQIDFETRRFYTSFKTDYQESELFYHRADTLQVGFAPYAHQADGLATWLILSGRRYISDLHDGEELALILRFFRKSSWLELGVNDGGGLQAMTMFTF